MALARSGDDTVFWDQVVYRGAPSEFVWVMPLPDGASIEVGDDAFFDALMLASRVRLETSWATCTGDTATRGEAVSYDGTVAREPVMAPDFVDLYATETRTVGPYEVLTLAGDPELVVAWLLEHDYALPEASANALRRYAPSTFAVVRLAPGEGVDRMAPIRVRVPGPFEVPIPLVSAGAEAPIDLEIFLFGDVRLAVTGYDNTEVDRSRLVYNPDTLRFNYEELFEMAVHPPGSQAAGWVTEFAGPIDLSRVAAYRAIGPDETPHDPSADVAALSALFAVAPLAEGAAATSYLTRVRTRLDAVELERDLGVVVASSASAVPGDVEVTRLANPTHCPDVGIYDVGPRVPHPCRDPICLAEQCTCNAQHRSSRGAWGMVLMAGVIAVRRARRR
jgi:hypothetical protein